LRRWTSWQIIEIGDWRTIKKITIELAANVEAAASVEAAA
jgi:hypothetical protein